MGDGRLSLQSFEPIFPVADVVATVRYYLKDIMVLPEWQGRTVGTRIVQSLLAIVQRTAPAGVLVTLFTGQNLAGFYEQFGFRGHETALYGMSLTIGQAAS